MKRYNTRTEIGNNIEVKFISTELHIKDSLDQYCTEIIGKPFKDQEGKEIGSITHASHNGKNVWLKVYLTKEGVDIISTKLEAVEFKN